jgi:hypothetical protein
MSLKTILFSILSLIVGILIGAASVCFYFGSILPKEVMMGIWRGQFTQSIPVPLKATPDTVPLTTVPRPQVATNSLGGTIESFVGESMVIRTFSVGTLPQAAKESVLIQVTMSENTKFRLLIPKNQVVFQKELADFHDMSPDKRDAMTPPLPFRYEEISRDAFTVGRQVGIESVDAVMPQTTTVTANVVNLLPETASVSLGQ